MTIKQIVSRQFFSVFFAVLAIAPVLADVNTPSSNAVTVTTDFPGGNVFVKRYDGNSVHVAPDVRGDNPWFYWYFEATANRPGLVRFLFPDKVAGFRNGAIGFQGPAISTDGGKTWKWMGTKTVKDNTFHYHFAKKGQSVRFAVTIPYVQSNLAAFVRKHAKNSALAKSVLTKSRAGRPAPLLRIGKPGKNKEAIIMTARHHAVETMASFVLEGILEEAAAPTPDGKDFRKRFVLYAIPFVDIDGVEKGDQGKNRKPRDYNRDYRETSIYPEVRAIRKLQRDVGFRYALDLHCPTLVMKDHQILYFVGAKSRPANNHAHVSAFAERIKRGLPKTAPYGPLVWLRDRAKPAPMFSWYFANQKGVVMSATLEVPYAPPGKAMDPASCRRYGRTILRALAACGFVRDKGK